MPTDPKPSERKLTEDLLAGFDRTGRTPKAPPVTKDFVDFHRKPLERVASPPRVAEPTFVIRPQRAVPAWLPWVAVVLVMLVAGAGVAMLVRPAAVATPEPPPGFAPPAPPPVATTTNAAPTETVEPPVAASVSAAPTDPSARPQPAPKPRRGFLRQL